MNEVAAGERVDNADVLLRCGPADGASRVVVTVAHAGQDLFGREPFLTREGLDVLTQLEDRHADTLTTELAQQHPTLIMRAHRALVDVNRTEADIDGAMLGSGQLAMTGTSRSRTGLGLFPRWLQSGREIWSLPLTDDDVAWRLEAYHAWHAVVARMIEAARAAYGSAVLLDLHSMPASATRADIVLGDRFGKSAGGETVSTLVEVLSHHGLRVERNHPYAGGAGVERHGRPEHGVDAVQIEVNRGLYLASDGTACARGRSMIAGALLAAAKRLD